MFWSFVLVAVVLIFWRWWLRCHKPLLSSAERRQWFEGKVVWVTGASSGIGEALACELTRCGAKVILSSRREKALKEVKEKCIQQASGTGLAHFTPHVVTVDLEDLDSLDQKCEEAISCFGHVDVIVHNGGISSRGAIEDTTFDVDRKVMDINYFGAVKLTKAILPHLFDQKSGNIVVVSSIQGKLAIPFRSAYTASKHALHGFFDSLRYEVADRNIEVLLACPGYVRTNISLNAVKGDGSGHNQMDENTAKGASPESCACAILDGMVRGEREVLIARDSFRLAVVLRDILPGILYKAIRRRYK